MQVTSRFSARRSGWLAIAILPVGIALALALAPGSGAGPAEAQAQKRGCNDTRVNPGNVKPRRASRAVMCLINRRRAARGLPRVDGRRALRAAAKRHSRRMVRTGCFAHRCPGQKDLSGRVHETAYLPCTCHWGLGETIAAGNGPRGKPRRIVRKWMRSSAHRSVILDPRLRDVGVGVLWGAPWAPNRSRAGTYTANFGFRR